MSDPVPFTPTNGRVLVRQLPYKPSKIIQAVSIDKADENEGIVVALSRCQFGRKAKGSGKNRVYEHTGVEFPHEVKIGDRVFFKGSYGDEDVMTFNGVKHRCLNSFEIIGVMNAPQPEGLDNPITGEHLPDLHPIHILT